MRGDALTNTIPYFVLSILNYAELLGSDVVTREATIDQGFRSRPIEVAELASLDSCRLARVEHFVLEMTRAELRAKSVPQELQELHSLAAARFGPAHVTLDVGRRAGRAQLIHRRRQLDQATAHQPADLVEQRWIHRLQHLTGVEQCILGPH